MIILRAQVYESEIPVRPTLTQMGRQRPFLDSADDQSEVYSDIPDVAGPDTNSAPALGSRR